MPFKSKAQNAWAHTPAGTKALGGPAAVKEWESATDYSHLPERKSKGYAKGGVVKVVDQDTGDHIPKGKPFHHDRMAGGGGEAKKGIGGHNDGHGVYDPTNEKEEPDFAAGGPVRNSGVDKHYKVETRSRLGQFLGKSDRFTGGRETADWPESNDTAEEWIKPAEVGTKEDDDYGDCKTLKPVLPHKTGGRYSYAKGDTPTTTHTFHEAHEPKED